MHAYIFILLIIVSRRGILNAHLKLSVEYFYFAHMIIILLVDSLQCEIPRDNTILLMIMSQFCAFPLPEVVTFLRSEISIHVIYQHRLCRAISKLYRHRQIYTSSQ